MEHFEITISETKRGVPWQKTLIKELDLDSDKPLKDAAKIMCDLMSPDGIFGKYPNGLYVRVVNEIEEEEHFLLVHTHGGEGFIRYATYGTDGFSAQYYDSDVEPQYLTCIDDETNEYKYYLISVNPDGTTFETEYGRIGGKPNDSNYNMDKEGSHSYPLPMFWVKYYEKISKGYTNQTELKDFKNEKRGHLATNEYAQIDDADTNDIINRLIANQRQYVQKSFDLSVPFSHTAIDRSKQLLKRLSAISSKVRNTEYDAYYDAFRSLYKELLTTLPRRVDNVNQYISRVDFIDDTSDNYITAVLENEENLLLNLEDLSDNDKLRNTASDEKQTALDKFYLSADTADFKEKFYVMDKMEADAYKLSRVLSVRNNKTAKAYRKYKKDNSISDNDCHLLWHGSRTENWWSIFKSGLSLNPDAVITGKMFGNGLYFAPKAHKSLGYSDVRGAYWTHGTFSVGYMALYEVAMGRSYKPAHSLPSNFSFSDLKHSCQSVWAYPQKAGLMNEECIIYHEEQCNIRYLCEVDGASLPFRFDIRDARELHFTSPRLIDGLLIANIPNFRDCITLDSDCYKVKNGAVRIYYDLDKKTFEFTNTELQENERNYLSEIFMSRFADNKKEFGIIIDEIKEKDTIPQDILKRIARENKDFEKDYKKVIEIVEQ